MRVRRFLIVGVALATMLALMASMSIAQIANPIPEPIEQSDVPVAYELVADGFTTPVWGTTRPRSSQQLYVVDQTGKIWAIGIHARRNDPPVPDRHLFLDVGPQGLNLLVPMGGFEERGLLGLAFHPDYTLNGLVYTFTTEPTRPNPDFSTMPAGVNPNSQSVIREWRVNNHNSGEATVDPASSRILLRWDKPQFNHNGGAIVFDRDRYLYISVGDGGQSDDEGVGHAPQGNGQDLSPNNVLGKILRIDPLGSNSANGQYGIPRDNPFVGPTPGADEVYAYGLRNPFRIGFDAEWNLWAADVGQGNIEEVNIIRSGGNYGWPLKEGTFTYNRNGTSPGFLVADSPGQPPHLTDPIAQYDHGEGISITGGFVYETRLIPGLQDKYIFGDWRAPGGATEGRVFHLTDDDTIVELPRPGMYVTGFGIDRHGEVYVMGTRNTGPTGTTGAVYKIVNPSDGPPPTTTTTTTQPPTTTTTTTTQPPTTTTTTTTQPPTTTTTTTTQPPTTTTTTTTQPPTTTTTTTTQPPTTTTTTTTQPPTTTTTTTTQPPTTTTTQPPTTVQATAFEFGFAPDPIQIAVGGTIRWTNTGEIIHTSTSAEGDWDSGILDPGEFFQVVLTTAGTYDYFCQVHPGMDGTVVVGGG